MILEGLVTTLNEDGTPHLAPMGPEVSAELTSFVLKPFQTSRTFANLQRLGQGVLHVTDDVELFARAAIDRWESQPACRPAPAVQGVILTDACRWYAFRVRSLDVRQQRARLECEVAAAGSQREFFGFNRAKHAVLEAAILATRRHLLSPDEINRELGRLAVIVDKTGGLQERRALQLLLDYCQSTTP